MRDDAVEMHPYWSYFSLLWRSSNMEVEDELQFWKESLPGISGFVVTPLNIPSASLDSSREEVWCGNEARS